MKKLEKLTLKELEKESNVLTKKESSVLFGGDDGAAEYYERYGVPLPDGCVYNPNADTVGPSSPGSVYDATGGTWSDTKIGDPIKDIPKFILGISAMATELYLLLWGMGPVGGQSVINPEVNSSGCDTKY